MARICEHRIAFTKENAIPYQIIASNSFIICTAQVLDTAMFLKLWKLEQHVMQYIVKYFDETCVIVSHVGSVMPVTQHCRREERKMLALARGCTRPTRY